MKSSLGVCRGECKLVSDACNVALGKRDGSRRELLAGLVAKAALWEDTADEFCRRTCGPASAADLPVLGSWANEEWTSLGREEMLAKMDSRQQAIQSLRDGTRGASRTASGREL
eukprot:TRINITY_DN19593_c0_g2_i1.p1 TRINITY_DN19593_c0_g2~~TRINITY_DN19593_c0_g2_i1.p1  ORF type:complete len:114 (-),score=18.32 TRINITY_DN19593_c0_g2_i1:220-561(-)